MIEPTPAFWTSAEIALIGFCSFVCASILVVVLTPIARRLKLVDEPNARKQHIGSIPLVGGLSIALSVILVMIGSSALSIPSTMTFLVIGFILMLLGMLDDRTEVRMRYRLLVQIIVGLALCFVVDLKIVSVGDLIGNGYITFGVLVSVVFTVLCSVGVFNSINMIDGIDGLAGSIVTLSAAAMACMAYAAGDSFSAGVLTSAVCAVVAYLLFNLGVFGHSRKIFMGDSGSLFLGFLLLWYFIHLSQGQKAPISPVAAGWIFGLPLADTVSVIVGRVSRGENPLSAGRDHIHHVLLRHGLSSKAVLFVLSAYHALLVAVGIFFNSFDESEPFLFWGFVVLTVLHFTVLTFVIPRFAVRSEKALA